MDKENGKLEHGQSMEQTKSLFACATQVWLTVNHNTNITSGE